MTVSKKFVWGFLIVFAILMVILAIGEIDYEFSGRIVNPDSGWAGFFNLFGEQPAFMALYAGILIIYGARDRGRHNALKTVAAVPLVLAASFQIAFMPVHYVFEHTDRAVTAAWWAAVALLTIVLCAAGMLAVNRLSRDKLTRIRKFGLVLVILVVSEIILVNILKIVWARPRMRSLDSIDSFRYWYQINGLSNDNELKSFPSGHTANGFVAIAYVMFFSLMKKAAKNIYLAFAVLWGVLVALSRVVRGDHFLSDVLMSCALTFALFLLIQKIVIDKRDGETDG